MGGTGGPDVTRLLQAWGAGDAGALEQLAPAVFTELHRVAARFMRNERPGHTLQTTALVNEAYLRLVDGGKVRWQDRAHFFAVAANMMRRILVDRARARTSRSAAEFANESRWKMVSYRQRPRWRSHRAGRRSSPPGGHGPAKGTRHRVAFLRWTHGGRNR